MYQPFIFYHISSEKWNEEALAAGCIWGKRKNFALKYHLKWTMLYISGCSEKCMYEVCDFSLSTECVMLVETGPSLWLLSLRGKTLNSYFKSGSFRSCCRASLYALNLAVHRCCSTSLDCFTLITEHSVWKKTEEHTVTLKIPSTDTLLVFNL